MSRHVSLISSLVNSRLIRSILMAAILAASVTGCGKSRAPVDQPKRYTSIDKLRERLAQVVIYGDGGSSLGGIPESIDDLLKTDPEKGKILQADFLKLNTATEKEDRKRIAQDMVDKLK